MLRKLGLLTLSVVLLGFVYQTRVLSDDQIVFTDPAEAAAKDPDYVVQGEYVGDGTWLDGSKTKVGAQVIAQGKGEFELVVTKGGLPGDGWKRDDARFSLNGKRDGKTTTLTGKDVSGKITDGTMAIASNDGKAKLQLKHTVRHSPTEGAKPPAGAVVLFDGKSADKFIMDQGQVNKGDVLTAGATTKQGFSDYTLHLELCLAYMPEARGQARSNSGVYLHDCYECQVLDSFGLEGENNECGGFYQVRKPDVNMCFPPLTWQTYDFEFTAPKYEDGKKVANARVTVKHNGVVIQPNVELPDATPGRDKEGPAPRPIYLQEHHRDKVVFRNIWLVEKK